MTARPGPDRGPRKLLPAGCVGLVLASAACSSATTLPPVPPCEPQPWSLEDAPRFSEGPSGDVLEVDGAPVAPPGLLNPEQMAAVLAREYGRVIGRPPPGVTPPTGIALFWLQVDGRGEITDRLMAKGTGHGRLDVAAANVLDDMELRPAFRQGCSVASWVLWPVIFRFFRINGGRPWEAPDPSGPDVP